MQNWLLTLLLISIINFLPSQAFGKKSVAKIINDGKLEVTDPTELKDLYPLYDLAQHITQQRKTCPPKDDRIQECLCDKAPDYLKFQTLLDQVMVKYLNWHYKILLFKTKDGKPATASIEFYYKRLLPEFTLSCEDKGEGKFTEIIEKEYQVLILKTDEDIKDLKRLHSYMGKQMNYESKCMSAGYSYNQCRCGNKEFYERYKLAFKLTKEKHPEWVGKALQYSKDGESMAQTLDNYERNMIVRDNFCSKKQSNSPPLERMLP